MNMTFVTPFLHAKLGFLGRLRGTLGATALIVPLLAGCGADFDPGSRVTSLRVLAEQADQPFARPGESVHLEALSFDPQARALSWAWAACVDPAASTVEGCLGAIGQDAARTGANPVLAMGEGLTSFDFAIPPDALARLPESARPSAMVGVLSVACPGELSLASSSHQAQPFNCIEAGSGRALGLDEYVVGIKRVFLRSLDRNQNPSIAGVTFDGADWPATEVKEVGFCDRDTNTFDDCKSDRHELAPVLSPDAVESGRDEFGNSFSENVIVQYYATEGIFKDEVRIADAPQTSFVARKFASGQELSLWIVARDDRGGVSWATRRVRVK